MLRPLVRLVRGLIESRSLRRLLGRKKHAEQSLIVPISSILTHQRVGDCDIREDGVGIDDAEANGAVVKWLRELGTSKSSSKRRSTLAESRFLGAAQRQSRNFERR